MVNEAITSYDVVVIGAGPAGSSAARYSVLGGAKTLLLDKKINIGEPVRCGEFIPANSELREFFPSAKEGIEELFNFPRELIAQQIKGVQLVTPFGKVYEFPLEGYTVERKWFDKYLVEEAAKSGAIVKTGEKVIGLEGDKVVTEKKSYQTKVIIGADGPSSLVAGAVSLPLNDEYALCAQYVMEDIDIDPQIMEMYSGEIAPGAYAWIIPKGEGGKHAQASGSDVSSKRANVGVGIRKRFAGQVSLRSLLEYFVKDFPPTKSRLSRGRILSFITGLVPTSGSFKKTVQNNVLLVGDAAGQVLPITGGGIPTAMLCGRIAGKVVSGYLRGQCQLADYEELWREELGKNFFSIWRTCKKFEWLLHSDFAIELLLRILKAKGIEKLIKLRI